MFQARDTIIELLLTAYMLREALARNTLVAKIIYVIPCNVYFLGKKEPTQECLDHVPSFIKCIGALRQAGAWVLTVHTRPLPRLPLRARGGRSAALSSQRILLVRCCSFLHLFAFCL